MATNLIHERSITFGSFDDTIRVRTERSARSDLSIRIRARLLSALRAVTKSIVTLVPIGLISTLICFGLLYLSPINAAAVIYGEAGTPAKVHQLAVTLGINRPYLEQYASWLWAALHGNLGDSYITRLPVAASIWQRLPVDLSIGAMALVFAVVLGFSAGIVGALRRGSLLDRLITSTASLGHTIPEFWLGILLVIFFAVHLRWLPASGYIEPNESLSGWFAHALLPALSLCVAPAASVARQVRTGLVGVLSENYIVGATVRGLSRRRILWRHALRGAIGPAITVLGSAVPMLLGGAIIAEQVFGLPGIGQFAVQGAQSKDMPVIQGVLLVLIGIVMVSNLLVNAALGWLRPETRR